MRTRISERKPFSFGIVELYPGKPAPSSMTLAMPFEWWLRPVRRHARVGEHSAVVWKLA